MYILKRQIILKPGCCHFDVLYCLGRNSVVQGTTWWTGTVLAAMGGRWELGFVDVPLALGLQIRGFMLFPAHNFYAGLGFQENEVGSRLWYVSFICGFPTSVGVRAGPCHLHKYFFLVVDTTIQIKRSFLKMSLGQHFMFFECICLTWLIKICLWIEPVCGHKLYALANLFTFCGEGCC